MYNFKYIHKMAYDLLHTHTYNIHMLYILYILLKINTHSLPILFLVPRAHFCF